MLQFVVFEKEIYPNNKEGSKTLYLVILLLLVLTIFLAKGI